MQPCLVYNFKRNILWQGLYEFTTKIHRKFCTLVINIDVFGVFDKFRCVITNEVKPSSTNNSEIISSQLSTFIKSASHIATTSTASPKPNA